MPHRRFLDIENLRTYIGLLEEQADVLQNIIDTTSSPVMLASANENLMALTIRLEGDRAVLAKLIRDQ